MERQGMEAHRTLTFVVVVVLHGLVAAAVLQPRHAPAVPPEMTIDAVLLQEPTRAAVPAPALPSPALLSPAIEVIVPDIRIAADAPVQMVTVGVTPPVTPARITPPTHGELALRVITPADYLRSPAPRYPPLAKQLRQQGVVMVRVRIAASGEPLQVDIEQSSGFRLLDDAALAAVRKAWFRPLQEGGIARAIEALVPIEFITSTRIASR